jgi:hypothetical protein
VNAYELDKLQCTAKKQDGKRCTRIATHGNGGGVLCERHHQMYLAKKANDSPIVRKAK